MKLNGLTISVILLAVLGGAVYWSEKQKTAEEKQPPKDAPPKIVSVPAEEIREIQIQRIGKPMLTIRRAGSSWTMVEPHQWPIDEDAANSVVTTLASLESDRLVEEKSGDLGQFGLLNPYLQVGLKKADGKEIRVAVGDDVPTGGNAFAKSKDSDRIYVIASHVKTSLDKTAYDLRDKRLIRFDPDKLTRVRVQAGPQTYEFGKNAGNEWQIIAPKPMRADASQVDDLVRKLKDAKMGATLADDEIAVARKNFATAKPVAIATVTDAAGEHRLEVRTINDVVYAKGTAAEDPYKVETELGTIGKDLGVYRNKKLFDFGWEDPTRIEVDGKVYEKKDTNWLSGGKTMDSETVQTLIDKLRSVQAARIIDSAPKVGESLLRMSVTSKGGKLVEKISVHELKPEYVVIREGDPAGYVIPPGEFTELKTKATGIQEPKKSDAKKDEKK
jgi:hypothetical protein